MAKGTKKVDRAQVERIRKQAALNLRERAAHAREGGGRAERPQYAEALHKRGKGAMGAYMTAAREALENADLTAAQIALGLDIASAIAVLFLQKYKAALAANLSGGKTPTFSIGRNRVGVLVDAIRKDGHKLSWFDNLKERPQRGYDVDNVLSALRRSGVIRERRRGQWSPGGELPGGWKRKEVDGNRWATARDRVAASMADAVG